jgi:hypothetical protein
MRFFRGKKNVGEKSLWGESDPATQVKGQRGCRNPILYSEADNASIYRMTWRSWEK